MRVEGLGFMDPVAPPPPLFQNYSSCCAWIEGFPRNNAIVSPATLINVTTRSTVIVCPGRGEERRGGREGGGERGGEEEEEGGDKNRRGGRKKGRAGSEEGSQGREEGRSLPSRGRVFEKQPRCSPSPSKHSTEPSSAYAPLAHASHVDPAPVTCFEVPRRARCAPGAVHGGVGRLEPDRADAGEKVATPRD
eukprot:3937411-Rhodomonas_salina.2